MAPHPIGLEYAVQQNQRLAITLAQHDRSLSREGLSSADVIVDRGQATDEDGDRLILVHVGFIQGCRLPPLRVAAAA